MSRTSQAAAPATSEWLLGALKQNPEGLLLLAAGAALLLRKTAGSSGAGAPARRASGRSHAGGLSEAVSGAQDFANDIAGRARETVESVASSASDYTAKAGRAVGEQSGRVARQAQSTAKSTVHRVLQEQPLAIAIAGLAAGAAIAAAFPVTELEKEHLGALGNEITGAARQVGDQLKDATAKAGELLKNAADERGLNPDGLKEVASDVASAFSSSMSGTGGKGGAAPQPNRADVGNKGG